MSLTLLQKWKLITAIVRHPEIKAAAVEVAISMLNFLNTKTLQCNPSYQTIADATGLSRDTVMVSVQCLEAVGVLRVSRAVEAGQKASKGQHLPSNSFKFNFEWPGVDQSLSLRSRKIRASRIQGETKSATTPVDISDHPQSEKPDLGSRKSRPKYGKEETGNIETGKKTRAAEADVTVTSAKIIFDQGLKYLQRNGVPERQARSLLGRWRADHGDDRTLEALRESHAQHASEPISFISGVLRANQRQQPTVGSRSASIGIEGA